MHARGGGTVHWVKTSLCNRHNLINNAIQLYSRAGFFAGITSEGKRLEQTSLSEENGQKDVEWNRGYVKKNPQKTPQHSRSRKNSL